MYFLPKKTVSLLAQNPHFPNLRLIITLLFTPTDEEDAILKSYNSNAVCHLEAPSLVLLLFLFPALSVGYFDSFLFGLTHKALLNLPLVHNHQSLFHPPQVSCSPAAPLTLSPLLCVFKALPLTFTALL